MSEVPRRVNIGCGPNPTPGWINFDNSVSVRIAKIALLPQILSRLGLLGEGQKKLIFVARSGGVLWADGRSRIPLQSGTVEVLYTAHMLEHLDRDEARQFLAEAYRVIRPDGVIRVVVPDLRKLVEDYLSSGDADAFIDATMLGSHQARSLFSRIRLLVAGKRHHLWMYDGPSLCRLLSAQGYRDPSIVDSGLTTIPQPGQLDLNERSAQSVYVEARK